MLMDHRLTGRAMALAMPLVMAPVTRTST